MPHANQPPDSVTGRPGKQFLNCVPIVLLPLLSSSPTQSANNTNGAQEAQKPCCSSNAAGPGWGPPSLKRQPQTTPVRPSFPFPPRPASYSKSNPASVPTSPSSITQPLRTNVQSPNKTGSTTSPPSSPTNPYPSSYSNRPSTTSPSAKYPYSSFHQRTQVQTPQSRSSWTPPSSLSHLKSAPPIKPREKPKFEFITLLDSGRAGPSPTDGPNGVEAHKEVRPEAPPLDSISKFPSGLTEIESKSVRDHHDDDADLEDHDQDHDLVSVTSSSSCPSLCTSSCTSCSASEVDTDIEHDIETNGRSHFLRGFSARSSLSSSSFPSPPFDLNVGLPLAEEVERHMTKKKPEPKKKKERKFILVNDMEIELDDSGSESEEDEETTPLSGSILSTSTSTTRDFTTTTTTTKTISTITTITTTTSSESPSTPQSIIAPVPVKSTLLGSQPPSPSLPASLITPPITPPSEQISRSGSRSKSLHSSSPSSPSTASRGRLKKVVASHGVGSSTSRERSGSTGSDTTSGGKTSPTSPTRSVMSGMCLPVKFKKQDVARNRV